MSDIAIKRGYEILPDNNVRFGIKVTNNTYSAISDVEAILDYTTSLFDLEGDKIQNLGNIPPNISRTAKFILKPKGCVHKENIEATIQLRDHKWKKHVITMRPKEVHCVCPFLKEKHMTRAEFFDTLKSGHTAETGLNFQGIDAEQLTSFLEQTCKNRQYKVDEYSIEDGKILLLASESIGEKAIYLLTAYIRENEGLTQVMLRAVSDKSYGLNGFLNEIVDGLRHIVSTVQSAREIGVIKKSQVINIIDSVVQRTTFGGDEGGANVNISDSVVQRTKFKGDKEKKRLEEERKKQDEQERLKKLKEEEERIRKEKKDFEQKRTEEEERRRQEEQERLKKLQAEEERINKEKEKLEQKRKEEDEKRGLKGKDKKDNIFPIKFLTLILVLSLLVIGYWLSLQWNTESETLDSLPLTTLETTINQTKGNNSILFMEIPENFTNSIGMDFVLIHGNEDAYYMGKFEVTQGQWREIMGSNPIRLSHAGDDLPMEWVSWNDAKEFIKKLNEIEGTDNYRLPYESEWEYAVKAGTDTKFFFGDNLSKLSDYAWYRDNSEDMYHPVGQKNPNPWGLYDVYGNVAEWVQADWEGYYENSQVRIVKGGCYGSNDYEFGTLTGSNVPDGTTSRSGDFGFRLVMDLSNFQDNTTIVISPEVNQTIYQTSETPLTTAENFTNSIGMEFVLIPEGEFILLEEEGTESSNYNLTISEPFYMGKYEVTQIQWLEIMGVNPSYYLGYDSPVDHVSWNDVQEFIDKLNEKEGTNKYRLPSSIEWEYTARAGTITKYYFSNDESELRVYAWYSENSNYKSHPVGQKKPNPWGLYDIHGNVGEWVGDINEGYYIHSDEDGTYRVIRGGSFSNSAEGCQIRHIIKSSSSGRTTNVGFRLLMDM